LAETFATAHLQSLRTTTAGGILYSARNCKTMGLEIEHDLKTHKRYDEKQKTRNAEAPIHHHYKIKTSPTATANLQNTTHKAHPQVACL
jgi:hypothetical protein